MRKCIGLKAILAVYMTISLMYSNSFGNSYELKWFNRERKLLIKIDLKTNQVLVENPKVKQFNYLGKLKTNHPEITSLNCNYFDIKEFKLKNRPVISITGTSLVYQFIQKGDTFELERLDQSYFKGYNFFAYQFVRKDTLFSIGGYGFWHYNNVLTYFDEKNKGWEIYKYNNEGPNEVDYEICGYDTNSDGIWTLNFNKPEIVIKGNSEQQLYFFDFKTKKWKQKGSINKELFINYDGSSEKAKWIQNKFLFNLREGCFIVDPNTNLVLLNDVTKGRFWGNGNDIIEQGDSTFIYESLELNHFEKYQKLKLPTNKIFSYFNPINDSFIKSSLFQSKLNWVIALIASIFILLFIKIIYYLNNKISIFNETEITFLKILLSKDEGISTEELNQYLDIAKKNVDIQKNQRNQFIKNINSKFQIKYNTIENIVERKSSDNDKRFVLYVLNEKYVSTLRSY